LSTGILFNADTLYEDGLFGSALQGKLILVAWSGELSRLATLNGTGDAIFICALAAPMEPRARMPQIWVLKDMLMLMSDAVAMRLEIVGVGVDNPVLKNLCWGTRPASHKRLSQ